MNTGRKALGELTGWAGAVQGHQGSGPLDCEGGGQRTVREDLGEGVSSRWGKLTA